MSWGHHLMLDVARCTPHTIRCPRNIEVFTQRLVKEIDMVAYGKPQIVMFGTGNKKGYTLVQLIETSNICAHFCEETNDMYLDVFSCKTFDPDVVRMVVEESFRPAAMKQMFVTRQTPDVVRMVVEESFRPAAKKQMFVTRQTPQERFQ